MDELIERARELARAATPGPWKFDPVYCFGWDMKDSHHVGIIYSKIGDRPELRYPIKELPYTETDAAFIAASRELVPQLADALEAAQKALGEISALVSERHGDDDAFGEDEDDENDLPVVITMKRIFNILDREEL